MLKRVLSYVLTFIIVLNFSCLPANAEATPINRNYHNFVAKYYGKYDDSAAMLFEIKSTDIANGTFTGRIIVDDLLPVDKTFENGTLEIHENYYECSVDFTQWWTQYSFNIKVYWNTGAAIGVGGGGILLINDKISLSKLYDTFVDANPIEAINEEDLKLCMALSNSMYLDNTKLIENEVKNILIDYPSYILDDTANKYIEVYNYKNSSGHIDIDKNNAPFAIMNRINSDGSLDIIVAVRGTYKDEWQGNTEITGLFYDSSSTTHYNFEQGENSLVANIKEYYNQCASKYENINLIITGHSRGAAIANLFAKDATDIMNASGNITFENGKEWKADIPVFKNVTAYTFACPNVAKYSEGMESYINIFNFWFVSDIVPTVPLTTPTYGWNYWKYGKSFTMDISNFESKYKPITAFGQSLDFGSVNNDVSNEIAMAMMFWPSVLDYYYEPLISFDMDEFHITTLFSFAHSTTNFLSGSYPKKILGAKGVYDLVGCPALVPLAAVAIVNLPTIYQSHSNTTYYNVITEYGKEYFTYVSYNDFAVRDISLLDSGIMAVNDDNEQPSNSVSDNNLYDADEIGALLSFANTGDNADALNWDTTDPSSWNEIKWDEDGHVVEIDFTYKWLTGSLDCSEFSQLQKLNIYANLITDVDLTGNTNLTYLDCSYNDLSQYGLDLSSCSSLSELYCSGCNLNALDVSNLTSLTRLSCEFNNLIALNINNCTGLTYISCPYNYLNIYEGSNLYSNLANYKNTNNAYINCYPQLLPNDAVVDASELQALENFANCSNNNDVLDWLDDNGNLSLDKLQCNALFKYDGEKYRIDLIDVSGLNVEGSLDLSAFTKLRYLYCNDTDINNLNISGCTELEIVDCSNSELTTLTLPTNIASDTSEVEYFDCENNHLDINIFTDAIVNNVSDDGEIIYRHQLIDASVSDFYADDYNAMVSLAQQNNNLEYLEWDLNNPGYWDDVNWKYDASTGKYRLLDCNMGYHNISGDIDLSLCEMLELYSFAGTDITTIVLPGSDIPDEAFMYCDSLEAVIVSDGATTIGNNAFKNCTYLQAIYLPNSITTISNNAFENSISLKIAGNSGSYAQTYANAKNIRFEPGYFICGRTVVRENNDNEFEYNYPVVNVNITYSDDPSNTRAVSNRQGYFVIFGLNNGTYNFDVSHPYGNKVSISTAIQDTSIIITTPFSMINFDWCHDGYINAKDYALLINRINNEETDINDIFFDINNDTVIDENDWMFASNFFVDSYINNEYYSQDTPMMLRTMPADNSVIAFEGNENMNGGWD